MNTLLRFKIDDKTTTINLIGSYEDSINIPRNQKQDCFFCSNSKVRGEVAELKSFLKRYG